MDQAACTIYFRDLQNGLGALETVGVKSHQQRALKRCGGSFAEYTWMLRAKVKENHSI